MHLMIKEYIGERIVTTAWTANMYLRLGPQSPIYLHLSKEDVARRQQRMEVQFLQPDTLSKRKNTTEKGEGTSGKPAGAGKSAVAPSPLASSPSSPSIIPQKRTTEDWKGKERERVWVYEDDDSESGENIDADAILEAEGYQSSEDEYEFGNDDGVDREIEEGIHGSKPRAYPQVSRQNCPATSRGPTAPGHSLRSAASGAGPSSKAKSKLPEVINISDSESDMDGGKENDGGWAMNFRGAPPRKKARNSLENEDIILLSD